MQKIIREEKEYRNIETNDIKMIKMLSSYNDEDNTSVHSIDIGFGEYGILIGNYSNLDRASEILEEIKSFLDDEEQVEYIVPKE